MLSNNPRADKFSLKLPKTFFKEDIIGKYNRYLSLKNSYFVDIANVVNESIQKIDIPGLSQELITQNTATSAGVGAVGSQDVTHYQDNRPLEEIIENNVLTVTFRHLDSYINYFFLMETFYQMYLSSDSSYTRFDLPVIVYSTENHPQFVALFSKCLFKSISNLNLAYDSVGRDFKDFQCEFQYSDFQVLFELPQGIAKAYK